jgi:hypothetical protein
MDAEIIELVRAIDDAPDKAHSDYTPAVHRLIEIGEPALPAVLPLLLGDDEVTRLRAQRVLEGVTMALCGFRPGHGWHDGKGEDEWRALWRRLGDLDWQASPARREAAVHKWRRWSEERERRSPRVPSDSGG